MSSTSCTSSSSSMIYIDTSSSPSSPRAAPSSRAVSKESESKRRRLRKGTHSCWECKRRKIRCIFGPLPDSSICNGCQRRGTQCVSQEFPEEVSLDGGVVRGETIHINRDARCGEDGNLSRTDYNLPTPSSTISEASQCLAFYRSSQQPRVENGISPAPQGKYDRLSRFLHESLPSREDTEKICIASRHPSVLAHEMMTMPYTTLDQNGLATHETLLEIPSPNIHPVLIARHMLLLASFLQHLHPDLHKEMKGLSESPQAIMIRLADLATSLVTTNDDLLGSLEGLECVMIESVYQANIGNLRRSWVSSRRAMNIAQLMGINRSGNQAQYKVLDSKTKYHPQHMWFRIVFLDRYLCLMLGLSQGCLDRSMASDAMLANDTPMGRLERIHCVIASQILERNESLPSSYDITLTRSLDVELQKAARSLPSKWWLAPNLKTASTDSQALFWNTRRIFAQIVHYNLLNQLHLPYMLCSLSAERNYEYSRITCVNSSREMLSRFIALRNFNGIACSCRTVDFIAVMAAMTLLLAHLDSNNSDTENLLAHQYHIDRAMIEQVQEIMNDVNLLNSDALSAQSVDLLSRLLTVDIEGADYYASNSGRVSVQEAGAEMPPPDQGNDGVVSVHIPYFGIIKIASKGMSIISPQTSQAEHQRCPPGLSRINVLSNKETITPTIGGGYSQLDEASMTSDTGARIQAPLETFPMSRTCANYADAHFASQPPYCLSDPLLQHDFFPELTAGTEDWAFQGVDLAFFESLTRNERFEGGNGTTVGALSTNGRP